MDRSVLVFDTHYTVEAGRELLKQIRAITAKPVRYVVNSHFHPDHTHGNQAFADAQFIGSTATRRDVLEIDLASMNRTDAVVQNQLKNLRRDLVKNSDTTQLQELRDQIKKREKYLESVSHSKIIPPGATFDDSMIVRDGEQEANLLWLGPGHTDGDIIIFLVQKKIAYLGDLFFNRAIPNVQEARMLEWIKTLKETLKLDANKFVPGHGAIGSRKEVETFLGYLEEIKSLVEAAIARGDSMEQATQGIQVPAKYAGYHFQNFFPSNIQKMFAELKMESQKKTESEKVNKE
jgi:glyoxylase-like metal-dependent hydrolase (beta-lactamase superfamily II)